MFSIKLIAVLGALAVLGATSTPILLRSSHPSASSANGSQVLPPTLSVLNDLSLRAGALVVNSISVLKPSGSPSETSPTASGTEPAKNVRSAGTLPSVTINASQTGLEKAPKSEPKTSQATPKQVLNATGNASGSQSVRSVFVMPRSPNQSSGAPSFNTGSSNATSHDIEGENVSATAGSPPAGNSSGLPILTEDNSTGDIPTENNDNSTGPNQNGQVPGNQNPGPGNTNESDSVPVIFVPHSFTLEAMNSSGAIANFGGISAYDQNDGNLEVICVPDSGLMYPLGITKVNCSTENSAGRVVEASFNVTVKDTTPPHFPHLDAIVANSTGVLTRVNLSRPAVTDLVDASPTVTNDAPADGFRVGNTTVNWRATDVSGNSASAVQIVIIKEPSGASGPATSITIGQPSYNDTRHVFVRSSTNLTLSASSTSGINGSYYRFYATGAAKPAFVKSSVFRLSGPAGAYTIEFYSVDSRGDSGAVANTTVVLDNSAPQANASASNGTSLLPGANLTISANDPSGGSGVGASSNSGIFFKTDSASTYTFAKATSASISLRGLAGGKHAVTYYAIDNAGNAAGTKILNFTIYDCSTLPLDQLRGVEFTDATLTQRQGAGSSLPAAPPSVDSRLADISSKGFNTIKVLYYWDAYEKDSSGVLNSLASIAAAAQTHNLCVIYDNHQTGTSFKFGGSGFPRSLTENYTDSSSFWSAYYNNTISVGGRSAWDRQADMMQAIIGKVNSYTSVSGYEILSSPYVYTDAQYSKLGQMQTYLADKIRSESAKEIFFDKAEPQYSNNSALTSQYVDSTYDPQTKPAGVAGVVFAPHIYDAGTPSSLSNLTQLAASMQCPILVGEWGQSSQSGTQNYVSTFRMQDTGWIRWSYDPLDLTYNLTDSAGRPTQNYAWLSDAMAH